MTSKLSVLFGGLGAAASAGYLALLVGAAAGVARPDSVLLTPGHILVACCVASVAGGFVLDRLARHVTRPLLVFAALAAALAVLASVKVRLDPPGAGFSVRGADALHATVAAVATLTLAAFGLHRSGSRAPATLPKVLASIAGAATALAAQFADFNGSHLFREDWTAHARYHALTLLGVMTGLGVTSLWMTWQSERSASLGRLLPALAWVPFLFSCLLPEASSWPDGVTHALPVNGNLILAVLLVTLCTVAELVERRAGRRPPLPRGEEGWASGTRAA